MSDISVLVRSGDELDKSPWEGLDLHSHLTELQARLEMCTAIASHVVRKMDPDDDDGTGWDAGLKALPGILRDETERAQRILEFLDGLPRGTALDLIGEGKLRWIPEDEDAASRASE